MKNTVNDSAIKPFIIILYLPLMTESKMNWINIDQMLHLDTAPKWC